MEKEKKNNKTYLLITLGVLAAIVLTLGLTYAYWRLTREQTNENVVTTACLDVDIESQQDDIYLPKAYPISDTDAESLVPFKFTIHNKCEDNASFQINLESMSKNDELEIPEAQRLNPKYLKFKLNEVNQNGITRLLTGSKEEDTTSVTPTITNAYDAHKLMSGYIEPSGSKSYEFRIWLDSETTAEEVESMNKTFVSKISVTSTYLEEEKIPPTAELALSVCNKDITINLNGKANGSSKWIKKYEYKVDNDEWQKADYYIVEILNQQLGKHTIKARVTDNSGIVSEEVEQEVEILDIKPEIVEIAGMQMPVATCKSGLYKVEHNNLTELDSSWNKTEYRFAGDGPNNYVEFNGEKWRIIGLVNVKTSTGIEQRVKIVRINSVAEQPDFGYYAWNYKDNNNWTKATLKDMLNGIYYESETGDCYTGSKNYQNVSGMSTCDFTGEGKLPKGLKEVQNMIDSEIIWNISGVNTTSVITDVIYEKERGTTAYGSNPFEWTSTNDNTYHKGIGLIYPSDYGYAVGGEVRKNCLENTNLYEYGICIEDNNWLDKGTIWSLTQTSNEEITNVVCMFGNVDTNDCEVSKALVVFPTLYLNKNVIITGGTGEINSPYQLSIN